MSAHCRATHPLAGMPCIRTMSIRAAGRPAPHNHSALYPLHETFGALALAVGPMRARDAALRAISSPLLEVGIERATGVVWNITGPPNMTLHEVRTTAWSLNSHVLAQLEDTVRRCLQLQPGHAPGQEHQPSVHKLALPVSLVAISCKAQSGHAHPPRTLHVPT